MITNKDDKGKFILKPELEWDKSEVEKIQYNVRALNSLYCSLNMGEHNKISSFKSAKEIWNKLEVIHEGTSQVKYDHINMLAHDYELFKMKTN